MTMVRRGLRALLLIPGMAAAAPWTFHPPVAVSQENGPGIFHHLGAGGRFGIAASGGLAAVVWEDNRDGVARCYLALMDPVAGRRQAEWQVSGSGAGYEPAVLGLGHSRFAVAWEEEGGVWLRIVTSMGQSPPMRVDSGDGAHPALAWHEETGLVLAWSRREGDRLRLRIARLQVAPGITDPPAVIDQLPVDASPPDGDQTYPSVSFSVAGRLVVAWEDRRHGHTVIMASHRRGDGFSPPRQVNESSWGGRELGLGRGTGAMRVSLASRATGELMAVWADKRDFRSGYDVYAAFSSGQGRQYGENQKVQDGFADGVGQWHPSAVGGGSGDLVAAVWDDDRDDTPDIWLSWYDGSAWSDDVAVPGASGEGLQVEPAGALDEGHGLHLAWVERGAADGPTRVRYLYAPRADRTAPAPSPQP